MGMFRHGRLTRITRESTQKPTEIPTIPLSLHFGGLKVFNSELENDCFQKDKVSTFQRKEKQLIHFSVRYTQIHSRKRMSGGQRRVLCGFLWRPLTDLVKRVKRQKYYISLNFGFHSIFVL